LTNVPGPTMPLYLAGGQVTEMMFWVPQSGSIGMGVSILSYNEQIFFGLIADRKLVPDPQRIIEQFIPELDKLLNLVMMLPIDSRPTGPEAEAFLEQALHLMGEASSA
jgi:hypothetical protein